MDTISRQKKKLRRSLKEKREKLPEAYCRQADEKILHQVTALLEYKKAQVIFCYVGTAEEINTLPILEAALTAGKRLGVPRCQAPGIMEVYEIKSPEDLETGHYRIQEPKRHCKRIRPEEIGLALLPCLAAAPDGCRLGYGGGYYDRYLPRSACKTAVLCRENMLEEHIPTETHDVRADIVVTEEKVYRVG